MMTRFGACAGLRRLAATLAILVAGLPVAHAEICGDADNSGTVTVSDGVQTLRAAAELPSACELARCDVDGSGTITTKDGVNVLRIAANLSAVQACPTATTSAPIDGVQFVGGGPAATFGPLTKVPALDAPKTIEKVTSGSRASIGGRNSFVVDFDVRGAVAASASSVHAAAGENPALIVAAKRINEDATDAFTLPLDNTFGQAKIAVTFPDQLDSSLNFTIRFATLQNDELSQFEDVPQTATAGSSCGDFTKDDGEGCDPPGTIGGVCGAGFCDEQCQCSVEGPRCGNGAREGDEECDGSDAASCGTFACLPPGDPNQCRCEPGCGNNRVDPDLFEQCDGIDNPCAPAQCLSNCVCDQ